MKDKIINDEVTIKSFDERKEEAEKQKKKFNQLQPIRNKGFFGNSSITYKDITTGQEAFTDKGNFIEVKDKASSKLAIQYALEKFPNAVTVEGSEDFKKSFIQQAVENEYSGQISPKALEKEFEKLMLEKKAQEQPDLDQAGLSANEWQQEQNQLDQQYPDQAALPADEWQQEQNQLDQQYPDQAALSADEWQLNPETEDRLKVDLGDNEFESDIERQKAIDKAIEKEENILEESEEMER